MSRQLDESMLEQARALKHALDAERRRLGARAQDSTATASSAPGEAGGS